MQVPSVEVGELSRYGQRYPFVFLWGSLGSDGMGRAREEWQKGRGIQNSHGPGQGRRNATGFKVMDNTSTNDI